MQNLLAHKKPWLMLFGLGFFCIFLSYIPPFSSFYISSLIIAIILGALFSYFLPKNREALKQSGVVAISTKQILRLGIILFGFRITLDDILFVGFNGIFLSIFVVASTFLVGLLIGKALGLDFKLSALISTGSAVCGAAAVMASQSILKDDSNKVAVALCTVVVFGTIGMFSYPFLVQLLGFDESGIGFFIGGSLHEVAHVVGASSTVSETTQKYAVIIKMLRVIMLVPLLFILGFLNIKNKEKSKIGEFVPYFAIWFLVMIALNSLLNLPNPIINLINFIDTLLLCVAMFCLGLGINAQAFKGVGFKPFILATLLFLYLIISCFLFINFAL